MKRPSKIHMPDLRFDDTAEATQRYRASTADFIPSRLPSEIFHNGASVEFHLLRHREYLEGVKSGQRARLWHADLANVFFGGWDLSGVDFSYSDFTLARLEDACLEGANLHGVRGNGYEIKSAQFDLWPVVWTMCPDYGPYLQVGCRRYRLEMWEKADHRWIGKLDANSKLCIDWWDKHGEAILNLVNSSPALPWSHVSKGGGNRLIGVGS